MTVSSAYRWALQSEKAEFMSFIKIINNSRGPNSEPCGTPFVISLSPDNSLLTDVLVLLFERQLLNHCNSMPVIPMSTSGYMGIFFKVCLRFGIKMYSLNKKEWICSLFKEWILEKSEIRVNLEWTFVLFTHFGVTSGITRNPCMSDPCGHSKMSE